MAKRKRFKPPTMDEARGQIIACKYRYVDPAAFINFYGSKGWMVGKNKMTNWRSAMAGWECRAKARNEQPVHLCRFCAKPAVKWAIDKEGERYGMCKKHLGQEEIKSVRRPSDTKDPELEQSDKKQKKIAAMMKDAGDSMKVK